MSESRRGKPPDPESRRRRRERWIVWFLLLTCIAAGALLRFRAVPSRFGPDRCADGDVYRYYVSVADSFLAGEGWETDYPWNFIPPPGQAAFLVAVRGLAPAADFDAMRRVQAWIAIAAIPLAFWIGLRMGGRWVGLAAAALIALDRQVAAFVGILLAESNYFVLLFLFLALLLEALRRRNPGWMAAAGCALALASLTKPFPMFLALAVPLFLVVRRPGRKSLLQAAAFFLGFALLVSPWLIRNYLRYDRFYLISTNAGTLLAQSNFSGLDPADPEQIYWEQIYRTDRWQDPAIEARFAGKLDRYGRPEWNERDRAYMRHFVAYAVSHPVEFTRNYLIKAYNVLRHPLPRPGHPWRGTDTFRLVVLLLGLPGLVWFAVAEWSEPRWIMVLVFAYFLGFTALTHIVRSGRINLPVKLLLGFFAAYLLGRATAALLRRYADSPTAAESRGL